MPADPTPPPAGDSEALHRIVDPYFWNPDTADALTGALIAAGFTRANHGETVVQYTGDFDPGEAVRDSGLAAERDAAIRERDEAREMVRVVDQRLADVHKNLTSERDAMAERLEAALTGYECKGCQASFRRENVAIARAEAAEKRATTLEKALREILNHDGYTMAGLPLAESMRLIARAALAGNGTGS